MPIFTYAVPDFIPFTKIKSADVNSRFQDIADFLNGQIGDSNIAPNSLGRATALAAGTANAVVINDGTGKMTDEAQLAVSRGGLGFSPTISGATAGQVIGVNDAGNALTLRTAEAAVLVEQLASNVVGISAGEAITANDAVSLVLNNGSYKIVRCQSSDGTRAAYFWGFALNSATVTPQITTLTKASSWTTGTVSVTVNGRVYSQAFTSNNDTSMAALAALIAADPEVQSAAGSGSPVNVITVTSKGGLSLVITSSSSGGAPTLTPANTQTATGQSVRVQMFGPLDGFSGMTTGNLQYTSPSVGGISSTQTGGAVVVGQALSSTVLFIFPLGVNIRFGASQTFIRSAGRTNPASAASATSLTEHFNGAAWALGTSATAARGFAGSSDSAALALMWLIDGQDTSGAVAAAAYSYNKSSWTSHTPRSFPKYGSSIGYFNGFLYANGGHDGSAVKDTADKYNLSAWSTAAVWSAGNLTAGCFVLGSLLYRAAGFNGSAYVTSVDARTTGDSVSSATALAVSGECASASAAPGMLGILTSLSGSSSTADSYSFNGSSWSSIITALYAQQDTGANGQSFSANSSYCLNNGGAIGGTATTNSQQFNGSAYSTAPASGSATSSASLGAA